MDNLIRENSAKPTLKEEMGGVHEKRSEIGEISPKTSYNLLYVTSYLILALHPISQIFLITTLNG